MKRKSNIFLALTLLTCCLLLGCSGQAEAASARTKALKAYKSMLSSESKLNKLVYLEEYGMPLSNLTFSIAYIDKDNVPELIVNAFDTQYVFTYREKKIQYVESFFFQSKLGDFSYYKKKGVFSGNEGHCDYFNQQYCTLKKGKSNRFAYKSTYKGKVTGYYTGTNNKKTSSSKFSKLVKKKGGKGKLTVIKSNKYWKNTSSNRQKYLR